MHRKAADLMTRAPELFDMASQYYKRNGRGALFLKFKSVAQLMEKSVRVLLLYIPLEQTWLLEYAELPRQVIAYEPENQYVLFLTVSTELVEGGELMQASTAHVSLTARIVPPSNDDVVLVSNTPAEFARAMENHSTLDTQPGSVMRDVCSYCYKAGAKLMCSRCSCAHYCTKACQVDHWRSGHRVNCNTISLD